jgi:DNA mismatch repair protein MutS
VELASYLPRVKNFNVAVTEEGGRVVFLHRVVPGGADRSYGIHVAQLAGLPKSVLHRAQEVLAELENGRHQKGLPTTSRRRGRSTETPPQQIPLFNQRAPVLSELAKIDLESLTPLEALNKLYELQKKARECEGKDS